MYDFKMYQVLLQCTSIFASFRKNIENRKCSPVFQKRPNEIKQYVGDRRMRCYPHCNVDFTHLIKAALSDCC